MRRVSTLIIGAGQCGLAISNELSAHNVDHIILERGQVANSWRTERWDSLRLLTPNWLNPLPGLDDTGLDADGFMPCAAFADRMQHAALNIGAPVQADTNVVSARRICGRYRIDTTRGSFEARSLVIATGACARAKVPAIAADLPPYIEQVTSQMYRRPSDLPDDGILVVGASASGLNIARELQLSGRQVTLAVGSHLRMPRVYRGADMLTWTHLTRIFHTPYNEVDDLERMRRLPSLPLLGDPGHADIDLNALQHLGVRIVGRLAGVTNDRVYFSGALANQCTLADLKLNRLLDQIDAWATSAGLDEPTSPPERPAPTRVPEMPQLQLDLVGGAVRAIVWATGYLPDHSWLDVPVFDRTGRIVHEGGVVAPGLLVMGLPYLRSGLSTHIEGASDDARALAAPLAASLGAAQAA
jgi:putative flavoprotein involved in K+ transport